MCFAEQVGLSPVLKESIELAARRAAGSLFQHLGPAAEKARSPNRVFIRLTRRSHLSVDRSRSPSGGSRILCLGGLMGWVFLFGGLMGIKRRRRETAIAEGKKPLTTRGSGRAS